MTDRFKETLFQFNTIDRADYENFVQENVAHTQFIWRHRKEIKDSLTLATEAEQIRKENEGLKAKLDKANKLIGYLTNCTENDSNKI